MKISIKKLSICIALAALLGSQPAHAGFWDNWLPEAVKTAIYPTLRIWRPTLEKWAVPALAFTAFAGFIGYNFWKNYQENNEFNFRVRTTSSSPDTSSSGSENNHTVSSSSFTNLVTTSDNTSKIINPTFLPEPTIRTLTSAATPAGTTTSYSSSSASSPLASRAVTAGGPTANTYKGVEVEQIQADKQNDTWTCGYRSVHNGLLIKDSIEKNGHPYATDNFGNTNLFFEFYNTFRKFIVDARGLYGVNLQNYWQEYSPDQIKKIITTEDDKINLLWAIFDWNFLNVTQQIKNEKEKELDPIINGTRVGSGSLSDSQFTDQQTKINKITSEWVKKKLSKNNIRKFPDNVDLHCYLADSPHMFGYLDGNWLDNHEIVTLIEHISSLKAKTPKPLKDNFSLYNINFGMPLTLIDWMTLRTEWQNGPNNFIHIFIVGNHTKSTPQGHWYTVVAHKYYVDHIVYKKVYIIDSFNKVSESIDQNVKGIIDELENPIPKLTLGEVD